MSELTQNIVVQPNNINITVDTNNINFTPTDVQLSIYTSSPPSTAGAGGSNTQLQFNNNGPLGGIPNVTWNGSKLSLGNVANVLMTGGTNGYVLQTDGTGNLNWTAMSGGGGNGSPGGSNTQVQFNDNGLFGGNSAFTFNKTTGNVDILNNINANTISGYIITGTQSNITSLGTLVSLDVGGTTTIQQAKEKVTANATGATGVINYNILDQAILYKTANATGNFEINFIGNGTTTLDTVMSSNQSMTCTLISTNGSTAYIANIFRIDGNIITPKWLGGNVPTLGTISGSDMYNFNILKTGPNTFVVFGSAGGYT